MTMRADTVGIVGSGGQARYQLQALLGVRRPRRVRVYGRSPASAEAYAREMTDRFGLPVTAVGSAREAVAESDVVVTTTPSREPFVRAEWLRPGMHITAVGSDGPDKQELEAAVLARADKVVADRLDQCLRLGEVHHAVAAGLMTADHVHGELGELAAGLKPGRVSDGVIWYAKSRPSLKYRQLFRDRRLSASYATTFSWMDLPDGYRRRIAQAEADGRHLGHGYSRCGRSARLHREVSGGGHRNSRPRDHALALEGAGVLPGLVARRSLRRI